MADDEYGGKWSFEKLVGFSNYSKWKMDMEYGFMDAKLNRLIEGTKKKSISSDDGYSEEKLEAWEDDDNKAKGKIGQMCMHDIRLRFNKSDSAYQQWEFFKKECISRGWANKWDILIRFERLHLDNCRDVAEMQSKIDQFLKDVDLQSITIQDYATIKILNSLGSKYETFLTVYSSHTSKHVDRRTGLIGRKLWKWKLDLLLRMGPGYLSSFLKGGVLLPAAGYLRSSTA